MDAPVYRQTFTAETQRRGERYGYNARVSDRPRLALFAAWLAAVSLGAGCAGYRPYGDAFAPELANLSVEVFANDTLYSGAEFDLTQAVQDELTRRRGQPLAAPDRAEAVLRGRLVYVSPREVLTAGRGDQILERQVTAVASVEVHDRFGKLLHADGGVSASISYRPAAGESEEFARRAAFRELARRIALGLLDR